MKVRTRRTLENCHLIKVAVTQPKQTDDRCDGYFVNGENCLKCKKCSLNTNYIAETKKTKTKKRNLKTSRNIEIKSYARLKKVYLWEIADQLGISDATMSRKLRYELSGEEKELIVSIIDEISLHNKEKSAEALQSLNGQRKIP